MNYKPYAVSMQTLFNQSANFVQNVCQHRHTDKNTAFCIFRVDFIAKTASLLFKYPKSVGVQVYTKPVKCTGVHKTSRLYMCTNNQFTVQVYTKPVDYSSVHKTSLLVNNESNVQGQNITKGKALQTMCKMCAICVLTMCKLCATCEQAVCNLVGISLNKLKVDN